MSDGASVAPIKAPPVADPLLGRTIGGRFKITGVIARGGMGKVYRAEQAPLGRVCALKVLNPMYSGSRDPGFHKRFLLEASVVARLSHPNTVTVFDYGKTDDGIYFMAMEYLEGKTLHRAIRQVTFMPEDRAAHIARQICRAVREAHDLGVIHRDLKPANIYLAEHGDETDFVKVLDFGLVKQVAGQGRGEELTQTGLFMGSPKYMAPEQIRGEWVDRRIDVYALGVILYEMVTGKVPFEGPSGAHTLMAHVNDAPPPIRERNPNAVVSPALEETIARCLAKKPDQRFASMDELLASLKAIPPPSARDSGLQVIAKGRVSPVPSGVAFTTVTSPVSRRTRSVRLLAGIASGLALVAGGVAGFALWRSSDAAAARVATPAADEAEVALPVPAVTVAPMSARANVVVKLRITTDPDGAIVKENGIPLCSSTPCDVLYADADPNRVHDLTVSLPGYHAERKGVRLADSPIVIRLSPK
ncbi:MAG: protein kinase [Polyangiaceae bacterium]|nr:protein kinase [Polyangiaceae bacterium]